MEVDKFNSLTYLKECLIIDSYLMEDDEGGRTLYCMVFVEIDVGVNVIVSTTLKEVIEFVDRLYTSNHHIIDGGAF